MTIIVERFRSLLLHALTFGRLGMVLVVFVALAGSGPAPQDISHDIDQLDAASQHHPTGACHQASHHCPVGVETAGYWSLSVALARENQMGPSADPSPDEYFKPFDTPPPRV